jgi:hypothetical protein
MLAAVQGVACSMRVLGLGECESGLWDMGVIGRDHTEAKGTSRVSGRGFPGGDGGQNERR